jgi:hypothetical protein
VAVSVASQFTVRQPRRDLGSGFRVFRVHQGSGVGLGLRVWGLVSSRPYNGGVNGVHIRRATGAAGGEQEPVGGGGIQHLGSGRCGSTLQERRGG